MRQKIIWLIKDIAKYSVLFLMYGSIYFLIESIYKGHLTHPLMFVVGGILGVLIGMINNLFNMDTDFILQCSVGMMIVLLAECIVGYQANIVCQQMIWDYSKVPLNFVGGQICVPFAIAWFILSGICIVLDDYLRYRIFDEEKPYYVIGNKMIKRSK